MGIEMIQESEIFIKTIGNVTGISYLLSWLGVHFSVFTLQDWVTCIVGAAAIFSYLASGIVSILRYRREKKIKKERGQ